MTTYTRIAWSPSRGRLLDNCARRYVLQHVIGQNDEFVRRKSRIRRLGDHARSGLRDALLARLENPDSSMNDLRMTIHRNVLRAIVAGEVMEDRPHRLVDETVEMMMHRLRLFESAPLVGFNRRAADEVLVIDRLQPLLLDGARQYGAPDLIVRNGSRLCLVRMAMEMRSRTPDRAAELELGSMLLWVERNQMIDEDLEDIDVVRIGWLGTRWVKWSKRASREWAAQARSMIAMDIEQMARLMIFDEKLEQLPRSRSRWRCSTCSFNDECPGFEAREKIPDRRPQPLGPLLS